MKGHHHVSDPHLTQNQGNMLGDRPCVRQSKIYRQHCGGNAMKELLGQSELKWDVTQTEGCYAGGSVYDHNTTDHRAQRTNYNNAQQDYNKVNENKENIQHPAVHPINLDNSNINNNNVRLQTNISNDVYSTIGKTDAVATTTSWTLPTNSTSATTTTAYTNIDFSSCNNNNTNNNGIKDKLFIPVDGGVSASKTSSNECKQEQQAQQGFPGKPVSVSTGRGFRQGAGYANRQTYNIFTGV